MTNKFVVPASGLYFECPVFDTNQSEYYDDVYMIAS